MQVDLPHPDGPTSATVVPLDISKFRPFNIGTLSLAGYLKCTSLKDMQPDKDPLLPASVLLSIDGL